jgi:3-deoxy-D-manno-octulosonic-acid transferase
LGEVVAVAPLAKALHSRYPGHRMIVSTVTETGREAVEQRLAGIAEHRYAPLDFLWVVSRVVDRWRPALYLFVETELWPNLLWTLRARGVPAVLVNGRLSSRSFSRQRIGWLRSFYRSVIRSLSLCLMQSDRDAQRIIELGADRQAVHVTGNIKFDQPLPEAKPDETLRAKLGVAPEEHLFLAGSTHAGEEEVLVGAYREIVKDHPATVLMLAPRHIERAEQVCRVVQEAGLPLQRRSQSNRIGSGPRAIVMDTRGELARAYREATVAFVGGTLMPVGGHNLLEPAVWGKPVLFGPYTDHCAEVAELLLRAGGGCRVDGVDALVRIVSRWLADRAVCAAAGQAAQRVVLENQGALMKSLALIESCLAPTLAASSRSREQPAKPILAGP